MLGSSPVCADDTYFPTPDNLKHNVEFWKKIYTEVSLKEGLLHDREYPMVIYGKMKVGERSGLMRTNFIRGEKRKVEALLSEIRNTDKSKWSKEAQRIVALFERYADEDALRGAHNRIRFQSGQKERFKQGIYRSGAYLDTISAILREYNVPQRLKYLPHVESSFNPHAYSKVGAAGMWQFMRSTGRLFMKIDYDIDQRRDPIASTVAAAKLLSLNYKETKAWPLAITAYNHGLYGIKRAIANTGSRDIGVIVEKHTSRSFRFASKNFYSCFLAATEIAAEPEKYLEDVKYAPKIQYTNVALSHYIKPSTIASAVGVPLATLMEHNPAIRPVVYQQDKPVPAGYAMNLPMTIAPHKALASLASLPDSLKFEKPPKPKYYKVRRGDNLYAIARRFGVSARELALYNDISRMNRIYSGQIINIPGTQSTVSKPAVVASNAVENKAKEKIEKVDKATKKATKEEKQSVLKAPEKQKSKTNTAALKPDNSKDDQLRDSARIASVLQQSPTKQAEPVEKRQEASDDQPSSVGEDQLEEVEALPDSMQDIILAEAQKMPKASAPMVSNRVAASFDADVYHLETELSADAQSAEIRVSVNETIGHYADWLGIATWRIRRVNNMGRGSWIRIGQKLTIPVDETSLEQFVQRRLEYHMALEQDFYAQFKVAGQKSRSIRRGETPWDICTEEGGIPLWVLNKYNRDLDLGNLMPGQEITIPMVEEKTEDDYAMELVESYQSTPLRVPDLPTYPGIPSRLVP